MVRGYTDEELLDALRAFADDHDGRPPTAPEANDREGFPGADTFVRHFETWNGALAAAGLETRERGQSDADFRDGLNGASLADYWLCSHCGEPYFRADALTRHVASEHGDESDGCAGTKASDSDGIAPTQSPLAERENE